MVVTQVAALPAGEITGDRQPQARTAPTVERDGPFERPRLGAAREARPVVDHLDHDLAALGGDPNDHGCHRVPAGVVEEVPERLGRRPRVEEDLGRGGGGELEPPVQPRELADPVEFSFTELGQRGGLRLKGLALVDAGRA